MDTETDAQQLDQDGSSGRSLAGQDGFPHGSSSPWRGPDDTTDLDSDNPADANDDPEHARRLLDDGSAASTLPTPLPTALAGRLYVSHFLSTWNSRMFEFAAVLFLAAAFPGSLRPVSVYAVARGLSAVVFAAAVGAAIDRADRLVVVRASIVGQRVAVVVSCGLFWLLLRNGSSSPPSSTLFLLVVAACVEKLCAVMNLVAIERDWVVVLTRGNEAGRRLLNARMRRIDLVCKLVGPLAISLVAAVSVSAAIAVTLAVNAVSVFVEYYCIAVVGCPFFLPF